MINVLEERRAGGESKKCGFQFKLMRTVQSRYIIR